MSTWRNLKTSHGKTVFCCYLSPPSWTMILVVALGFFLTGCANEAFWPTTVPNYDHLVGRKYNEVIPQTAQHAFKTILDVSDYEEVAERGANGCLTIFGIRKTDGVIVSWRVLPTPSACKVARKAFNA